MIAQTKGPYPEARMFAGYLPAHTACAAHDGCEVSGTGTAFILHGSTMRRGRMWWCSVYGLGRTVAHGTCSGHEVVSTAGAYRHGDAITRADVPGNGQGTGAGPSPPEQGRGLGLSCIHPMRGHAFRSHARPVPMLRRDGDGKVDGAGVPIEGARVPPPGLAGACGSFRQGWMRGRGQPEIPLKSCIPIPCPAGQVDGSTQYQ